MSDNSIQTQPQSQDKFVIVHTYTDSFTDAVDKITKQVGKYQELGYVANNDPVIRCYLPHKNSYDSAIRCYGYLTMYLRK